MAVLVGKKAPAIRAEAVIDGNEIIENFTLEQFKGKKYVILFFYPADFTFVCPTELIAFQEKIREFEERNTVVIGCSVDSPHSHWKWLQTPVKEGGIQGVTYPIISDWSKTIAENYDVLAGSYDYDDTGLSVFEGSPVAYRGLFLIDKSGVVRHQLVNDLPLGRSIDEAIRIVEALQYVETHGEVCPANWNKGDDGLVPSPKGISSYLTKKKGE